MKLENKDELKEIDIKSRTFCYFEDTMRAWKIDMDTDFSGISLDEILYKNTMFDSVLNMPRVLNMSWFSEYNFP